MRVTRSRAVGTIAAILAVATLSLGASSASAAGPGYGDVSDAMVYGASGPVGAVLPALIDQDDESVTVAAPFPINFFGTKYDALCITTNGTISPVLTTSDTCSNNYDVDVENLALDSGAPVIAALALDLDPAQELWVPGVSVATLAISSGIATITTSAPHPYLACDTAYLWFPDTDPTYDGSESFTVDAVIDATTFTFATPLSDEPARAVSGATASIGDYDDTRDDTDSDGLADDGFGAVKQVYFGTTVIGGKQAEVITWYRVPSNDGNNSPLLSNTLQVVLIQEPTTAGATAGYDFTIQLNIGTATENDDGYSAADPSVDCTGDAMGISDCRWGMGWADYDSTGPSANAYELFAAAPINSLIDSAGTTALVNNRLNSAVLGRYTWGMVGGVTQGFAVPTLNGADAGPGLPGAALAATGLDAAPIALSALALGLIGAVMLASGRRRSAIKG